MADNDEPVAPRSIRDRIAALNVSQSNHQDVPASPPPSYTQVFPEKRKAPPPPLPPKRPVDQRSASTNIPPVLSNGISSTKPVGNQPASPEPAPQPNDMDAISRPNLPPRPARASREPSAPSLPPRTIPEQQHARRPSTESIASTVSARSVGSALSSRTSSSTTRPDGKPRMLAPEYDPASLPPLPERKAKEEPKTTKTSGVRAPLRTSRSTTALRAGKDKEEVPPLPTRKVTPVLPYNVPRPALPTRPTTQRQDEPTPAISIAPPPPKREPKPEEPKQPSSFLPPPAKREVKAPLPRKSALDYAMNKANEITPALPSNRPGAADNGAPPPIPTGSRPDLAALQASKPKPGSAAAPSAPPAGGCLICRDFSAPDAHAKRFPRQSIPSTDPNWLARELTAPFTSHTDKARVLFTWLHHNVAYDTVAFFGNNVKKSTPSGVIESGLAVCEGYAGLFSALALAAGLEAITVGGHGKGFGHSGLAEGAPIPPVNTNHAWNAVRIDGGQWKLIDCCWGAGQLNNATNQYKANFAPERFTQSNEEFGLDHWPQDRQHFYRADGRALSWEEYMLQDVPQRRMVYGNASSEHGLRKDSIQPTAKAIRLNDPTAPGPTLRFQMEKLCRHWRNDIHGPGKDYLFVLVTQGRDGREEDKIPFDTDGYFHWVDVPRVDLGAPGQQVRVMAITSLDGKDGRGLTKAHYLTRKGRCAWGGSFVADWDLVH